MGHMFSSSIKEKWVTNLETQSLKKKGQSKWATYVKAKFKKNGQMSGSHIMKPNERNGIKLIILIIKLI